MSKYDMLTPEYERALLELAAHHASEYEDSDDPNIRQYIELSHAVEAPTARLIALLIKADLIRVRADPEELLQQLQPRVSEYDKVRRVAVGWDVTDFYPNGHEIVLVLGEPNCWAPINPPPKPPEKP